MKFTSAIFAIALTTSFAPIAQAAVPRIASAPVAAAEAAGPSLLARNALLLTSPYLAEDLGFSKAQIEKRNGIIDRHNEKVARLGADVGVKEGDSSRYRAALDQLDREYAAALIGLLSPAQTKRFKQIALQAEGIEALKDSAVAAELSLSAAQKKKMMTVFASSEKADDAYQAAVGDALDKIPLPGDSAEEQQAYEKKQQAVLTAMKPREKALFALKARNEDAIRAMFTSAQKKKWAAMLGKPLKKR